MTIGIIGAGASGLMAAITAAGQGAKVVLIEKKDRIGKKILATGNGKCNFTNISNENTDYHSRKKEIYNNYISQYDEKAVISFFHTCGMLTKSKNGYCYPRSEQATTVLDILRQKIKELKVDVLLESHPISIKKKKQGFEVILNTEEKLYFHKIILACGSFAGEKASGNENGYTYAKTFGHTLVPVVPALVQVKAQGKEFKNIAGVRCEAGIDLIEGKKVIASEKGELQLTDYGISGIPVFQLSRFVSYALHHKKDVSANIDFLPEYTLEEWLTIGKMKWKSFEKEFSVEEFFQGFLNKKLNAMFLRLHNIKPETPLKHLSFVKIQDVMSNMKCWNIKITGTNPYESAQVCAGGIPLEEVTLHMESKLVPGLFFAGELLDVDGRCGGYNLQWAWTSGYLAGKYAATENGFIL